ncbi:hypothetical protein D3C86_1277020 [compost metagenome]
MFGYSNLGQTYFSYETHNYFLNSYYETSQLRTNFLHIPRGVFLPDTHRAEIDNDSGTLIGCTDDHRACKKTGKLEIQYSGLTSDGTLFDLLNRGLFCT